MTQRTTKPAKAAVLGGGGGLFQAMPTLALGSLGLNLLSLALPLSLLQIYDRILPNSSTGTLLVLTIGVLAAVVLEHVLRMARNAISGWASARYEHRAGGAAFSHILHTPLHVLERDGTGVHLERLAAIPAIKDFYAEQGATTLLDLPFAILFLALIWLLAGPLVVIPLVILMLFTVSIILSGRKLRAAIDSYNTLRDRRQNFVIELLNGIHSVKALAMESQMLQRYVRLQESVAKANYDVIRWSGATMATSAMYSQLAMVTVVAAGGWLVVNNMLTVGGLAACTLLAGRAMQPVQRAAGMWSRFQNVGLQRQKAEELFAMPADAAPAKPVIRPVVGELELREASFHYGEAEADVVSKVSLTLAPGACVGIVGANGCGKSTLLGLMRGALRPTQGEVLLDGTPVADWDRAHLSSGGIAYLSGSVALFRGTVLENLTLFRKDRRDAALQTAHDLGLDEVFSTLPQGYHTRIADGAADAMPRGIRQRIAIARALSVNPQVILFDEANTAIDGPGDEALRQYLEGLKGRRTLVLVTLRPSLLRLADQVFELKAGELRERQDAGLRGAPRPAPSGTHQNGGAAS